MPIVGVHFGSMIASAATGVFYVSLPKKGILRYIGVGDLDNPVTIDYIVLEYDPQGSNPVLLNTVNLAAGASASWEGEIPYEGFWRIKIAFSGATIGDRVKSTVLVDV